MEFILKNREVGVDFYRQSLWESYKTKQPFNKVDCILFVNVYYFYE